MGLEFPTFDEDIENFLINWRKKTELKKKTVKKALYCMGLETQTLIQESAFWYWQLSNKLN